MIPCAVVDTRHVSAVYYRLERSETAAQRRVRAAICHASVKIRGTETKWAEISL